MLKLLDKFINGITTYRLTLYSLLVLAFWSMGLSLFGRLPFSAWQLGLSALLLVTVCWGSNKILAKIFRAKTNVESALITGLILFFVMSPAVTLKLAGVLAGAGAAAMASKYFLALGKKHLFNPVAITAVIFGFLNYGSAWWVADAAMMPVVLVIGLLIVRKLRHFDLFFAALLSGLVAVIYGTIDTSGFNPAKIYDSAVSFFVSWPTLFFIGVMVVEPLTGPPSRKLRILYGLIVGAIFGMPYKLGLFYSTPEVALIVGNIFSYIVSPKYKLFLQFTSKEKIGPNIYHFRFAKADNINFKPGQYLEWTLPHARPDSRGNRRYFTIASAPEENTIDIGVRVEPEDGSSFKKTLLAMEKGRTIVAAQLEGDFVLPDNKDKKLAFIAGGIGITPFRSIISHLIETGEKRDIILFYACKSADDFVYKDIFKKAAEKFGLKVVLLVAGGKKAPPDFGGETGYLTKELIKKWAPDHDARKFYLSGPDAMVKNYKKLLRKIGVKRKNIKTDYFPGY